MKISGHFQTIASAENYAAIRTYTKTCKRHGMNVRNALQRVVEDRSYALNEVLNK